MLRRMITTGALVACAGICALAAERATYILSDGASKSGELVSHGSNRESLINGVLSLGNDTGGPEFNFPVSQVAVIDFSPAKPSTAELSRLPSSGQMLALRNGQTQEGTFVNIIGADTLLWKNQSGETQQYAVSDVARVYLNPQEARMAYNYSGPSANAVATSGQGATASASVQVQAAQAWIDGGITVKKGDRVAFNATGEITFGSGMTAGPDGNGSFRKAEYPVPQMPAGGLIGRVGTGKPFPIGSNTQPLVMGENGRLMLGVNDNARGDNSGAFTVTVTKLP